LAIFDLVSLQIFYHDHFMLSLPEGHWFPMSKYALLRQRVMGAGIVGQENLRVGPAATDEDLLRSHDGEYVRRVKEGKLTRQEIRRIDCPWSAGMVERSRRSVGSTIAACRAAGLPVAITMAGGYGRRIEDTVDIHFQTVSIAAEMTMVGRRYGCQLDKCRCT
jgi:acetoin utilization deacetylase AcuC-like enzyme